MEGEAVPFPEKETKGIEGIGMHAFGAMAKVAILVHENSQECRIIRTLAKLCECKPRKENTCTICGGGDTMSKPFQKVVFTFGAINDIYPEDFFSDAYKFSFSKEATCELAKSVFSSFYTQDDSRCYWNQLLRGQACGCPDNSEIRTLVWTQRCSGMLSLSGSLLIVLLE